jgi:hypothetical protein
VGSNLIGSRYEPSVVVVAVNVQDLLALDTQNTGRRKEKLVDGTDDKLWLFNFLTLTEYTRSSLGTAN